MPKPKSVEEQAIPGNPLVKDETKPVGELVRIYDEKDKGYLSFLETRLRKAKTMKEQPMPEFNMKTYYEYYEENEKIANTHHLDPKKNPDDVIVSAGTIEQKLDSLLSHVNNLNLTPEIFPATMRENDEVQAGYMGDVDYKQFMAKTLGLN